MPGDRRRSGYLATVGAVALGSGAAGAVGLILGLVLGVVFLGVVAVLLFDGSPTPSQTERIVNLIPVVVGVPCIALCTALSVFFLVERREQPTYTPTPLYSAGRQTVWAATVINTAAFTAVALLGPDFFLNLLLSPWLWPLYVVPVGLGARFLALRLRPGDVNATA